ncbi:MAG TPA: right-handed parallel beta-helix repeat-containing protein, partial [Verrucomicrobiae bacterium]|nr:right-handed parallel beta-helix repeat-containing protein [Verrucomicrobiae bacterium]
MRALFASVAILLSMLWSLAAPAATFYVDPVLGSDSYDGRGTNASGTTNRPFLTISRALDASGTSAGPGDTVYLRGGVYRGNTNATYCMPANIAANGTEDQPIAVVAYQNERPIIKGSQVARGPWVQVTGAEFTTNGFPAAGSNYIYKLEHWMCDTNGKLMLSYGQWSYLSNPQQVFVSASETNDGASLIQVSWPTSTNTTPPSSQFARNWGTAPPISIYQGIDGTESNMFAGSFYYREVTNAPGISDVSTVYVWLSDNSNPTNHVVEISTSTFVLGSLSGGGNYINYTNLAFRHSNQAAWGQGGGVIGVGAGGIMDSCDIQWLDYVGINVGPDGAITRSTISHIGRLGLSANAGARVDSCYMSACNYRNFAIGWEAGAIKQLFGSAGALIQNCEFTGNYGVSIWFDSVNQTNEVASIVRHNYIHNNVGFSEWEWDGPNYVTNRAMPQIQLEASRNVLVYNNLLVSNSTYSITLPGAQNCQVYNN